MAETIVQEVDINLDELLNPGGSSIITQERKPTIFSKDVTDLSFLDKEEATELEASKKIEDVIVETADLEKLLDTNKVIEKDKKFSNKDLVTFTKKLIEEKHLVPFDDDKPLEEYTQEDFEELYKTNDQEKEKKVREEVPAEFFQSLPEELQYAAKYVADGGKDLKGLFQALAQSRVVAETDITTEEGQESTVRNYLLATNFGTPDEIDEEIAGFQDRKELKSKAERFKPKLDAMQQEIISSKLKREETLKNQRALQAKTYTDNVYKVLEPGSLNGLKLDRKTQNTLFAGLVQPNYPSVSGKQTNLLGHLLEKYQFVEPNHALVAEVLWLLSDPEAYKQKVKESGKKEANAETLRKLKTEQSNKSGSSIQDEEEDLKKPKGIARPNGNFFKR